MSHSPSKDYILGTGDAELRRLDLQHRLWRPTVLAAWRRAGLGAGSRVLDVGAGPGFAALDLAELVGPTGRVVAVERAPHFTAAARAQATERGLAQLEVHDLDLMTDELPSPEGGYDAAWCRWVACFVPSPAQLVARLAKVVRPGGVVIFHEYVDYSTYRLLPAGPALEEFVRAVMASWRENGGEPDIARALPGLLTDAGFRLREAVPHALCGRPGDRVWEWPDSFIRVNLHRLRDLGRIDQPFVDRVLAEWDAAARRPESVVLAPLVLELVAERA